MPINSSNKIIQLVEISHKRKKTPLVETMIPEESLQEFEHRILNAREDIKRIYSESFDFHREKGILHWLKAPESKDDYLKCLPDISNELIKLLGVEKLYFFYEEFKVLFSGLPDLIVWNDHFAFFSEVKSRNDKFRDSQKMWIRWNEEHKAFNFELLKIPEDK